MRIAIVGAGAAGLTAAYGLRDTDNSIYLFEKRENLPNRNWRSCINLKYLSRKGLFGESILTDAPLDRKIRHRGYFVSNGRNSVGYRVNTPEGKYYSVNRGDLDRWFFEQVRTSDVKIVPGTEVKSLLREDGRVLGLQTDTGFFPADLVFICNGDAGRLVENEGYGRSLPSEGPNYLSVVQQVYDGTIQPAELPGQQDGSIGSSLFTYLLPSPSDETTANILVRLHPGEGSVALEVACPLNQVKTGSNDPRTLFDQVENLPLFRELLPDSTAGSRVFGLLRYPGDHGLSNLVDHGVALGGSATGAGGLFPTLDKFGTATLMGYQFTGLVRKMNRGHDEPHRSTLRKFYASPLRENPQFTVETEDWKTPFWTRPNWFRNFVDVIFGGSEPTLSDWIGILGSLPTRLYGVKRSPVDSKSILKELVLTGSDSLERTDPTFISSVKNTDNESYKLVLLNHICRYSIAALHAGKPDDRSRANRLIEAVLEWFRPELLPGREPDPPAENPRPTGDGIGEAPVLEEVAPDDSATNETVSPVDISLETEGSLERDSLEAECLALCPTGVFDVENGLLSQIREEDCIGCDYCHFGMAEIEVRSGESVDETDQISDPADLPLLAEANGLPIIPVESGSVCRNLYRSSTLLLRLFRELDGTGQYVTPEQREWYESLISLARRLVGSDSPEDTPDGLSSSGLDSLLERAQKSLAMGRLDYAKSLVSQTLGIQLRHYGSFRDNPEQLSTDYRPFYRTLKDDSGSDGNGEGLVRRGGTGVSPVQTRSDSDDEFGRRFRSYFDGILERLTDSLKDSSTPELTGKTALGMVSDDRLFVLNQDDNPEIILGFDDSFRPFRIDPANRLRSRFDTSGGLTFLTGKSGEIDSPGESYGSGGGFLSSSDITEETISVVRDMIVRTSGNAPERTSSVGEITSDRIINHERTWTHLEPQFTLALEVLEALRGFPRSVVDDTQLSHKVLQTAARLQLHPTRSNPFLASSVPNTDDRSGTVAPDERLVLGLIPFNPYSVLKDLGQCSPRDPEADLLLSLTDEEETLWSDADRDGIMDELVRQWRRTAGEGRQLLSNEDLSSAFKGRMLIRLFAGRCLLSRAQTKLRTGAPARRTKLVTDLWMRGTFEFKQEFEDPVRTSRTPDRDSSNEAGNDPGGSTRSVAGITFEFSDPSRAIRTVESIRKKCDDTTIQEDPDGYHGGHTKFLTTELRRIKSLIEGGLGSQRGVPSLMGIKTLRLVEGWLDEVASRPEVLFEFLDYDAYRRWLELRSRGYGWLFATLHDDAFQNSLPDLRAIAAETWTEEIWPTRYEDDELNDQVERAFDRADKAMLPYLTDRPNMVPWYLNFVEMLSEIYFLSSSSRQDGENPEITGDSTGKDYESWSEDRSRRMIEKTASLVAHGIREATNSKDAPEAQIRDINRPDSIYRRRYVPVSG